MKLNYLLHRHNTHAVCLKSTAIRGLFNDTETEEVVQRRTRREDDHKRRKDIRNWKKAERTHGWKKKITTRKTGLRARNRNAHLSGIAQQTLVKFTLRSFTKNYPAISVFIMQT